MSGYRECGEIGTIFAPFRMKSANGLRLGLLASR